MSLWCACACTLVVLTFYGLVRAQSDISAEYRAYTLKHKAVGDVEKVLADMLSDLGTSVHLIADPRTNQILLRGPDEVQQIARQLIDSIDRKPAHPADAKPFFKAYPCPKGRQTEIADKLRSSYSAHRGVRVAVDPTSGQLFVVAPPEIHAAIPQQLAKLGAHAAAAAPAARPETRVGPNEHFVRLLYSRVDQIERMLRDLFGQRLKRLASRESDRSDYLFVDPARQRVTLSMDRKRNGVAVFGPEPVAGQLVRLIQIVDAPQSEAGRKMRIVPVHKADPAKVRQAVEAYRSGYREGSRSRRQSPPGNQQGAVVPSNRAPETQQAGRGRFAHGRIDLVNYLFQPGEDAAAAQPAERPSAEATPTMEAEADEEQQRRRPRELGTDVEIEALPNLDVIILWGRDRDVDEVSRIIEEIERISAETEPVIEIYQLVHVQGEALSAIVAQVNQELIAGRQGRVSITPLVKPNALLLIGWGEAVKAVKELLGKLDQPVAPGTQFRVFPLRHAPAVGAAATVQSFFSGRAGLGTRASVTADVRANSLIVQAAPRDMAEVALLIDRLDRDESPAVTRTRMFKLNHSLAVDLGGILQEAINAARGGTAAQKSAALELLTIDTEGERIIRSGILDDVQITPNPRTNTLIISAPAENMELIGALIEQLDSPAAVAQIKVFKIVNGDANNLVTMLRTLLPARTGAAAGPQLPGAEGETSLVPVRFSVDTRTNSIITTGSRGDLQIIEALLLRLDEEDTQQRQNTVYRLRNAPALDVATAINQFLRSERQIEQAVPGAVSPFQRIESEVVVVPEEVSNSLIISATPRFFDDIMELVEKLDAEPPQVMIQVLIAEVALGNMDEFGIELGLQDSVLFDRSLLSEIVTTMVSESNPATGIVTSTEFIQAAENDPGFNFNNGMPLGNSGSSKAMADSDTVGGQGLSNFAVGRMNNELGFGGLVLSASSESVSVLIRALQECRRLRVLSRPQIMTLDNQPALIQVGKRVPRIVGSTISDVGIVNTIALENVGLILGVTPRISPDGKIVMEIDAEKSDVGPEREGIPVFISEGTVVRSPNIDLTTAQTTVSAADGETVVLGGLITKNTSTVQRRVPYLADIPLLGSLFRYDSSSERRTELLIIMTPHIVRNPEDAERIKQAEAARMNWCLGDVTEMHGPTGIYETGGMNCDAPAPVIYPDSNPRGTVPDAPLPEERLPIAPELIPPGELTPHAADPSGSTRSRLPRFRQISPSGPPARSVPPNHPGHPGPVAPADYAQPIPSRLPAQQRPVAPADYQTSRPSPVRLPPVPSNGPVP